MHTHHSHVWDATPYPMADHKAYSPLLNNTVYRDRIIFRCNEIDRINITESLQSIVVNFYRNSHRRNVHIHFAKSCEMFYNDLDKVCEETLQWLPSVKVRGFAFTCTCSNSKSEHFVLLKSQNLNSTLHCQHGNIFYLSSQQSVWLPPSPLPKNCVSLCLN